MDDLHKLAQRIADKAYEQTSETYRSAVYYRVYQAIMDNAGEIAVLFCDWERKRPVGPCRYPDWEGGLIVGEHVPGKDGTCCVCGDTIVEDAKKNPLDDDAEVDLTDVITMIVANDELHGALEDIITYARRDPENLGDADAILADILERAKEALNG